MLASWQLSMKPLDALAAGEPRRGSASTVFSITACAVDSPRALRATTTISRRANGHGCGVYLCVSRIASLNVMARVSVLSSVARVSVLSSVVGVSVMSSVVGVSVMSSVAGVSVLSSVARVLNFMARVLNFMAHVLNFMARIF